MQELPRALSKAATDGQKGPQDLAQDRTHLEWLLLVTGLIRVTHVSPYASSTVPPESQSLICCLSFPTCEVDEVMAQGRVFIFFPYKHQDFAGKGRVQGLLGPASPHNTYPIPAAITLQAAPPPLWGELILSLLSCRHHL